MLVAPASIIGGLTMAPADPASQLQHGLAHGVTLDFSQGDEPGRDGSVSPPDSKDLGRVRKHRFSDQ